MQRIEKGDLLISPPTISDSRFEKTVLLVTRNTAQGSLAFCLNRPTQYKINDVLKEIDIELSQNLNLHWGGPVAQNTVWMLHDSNWKIESTARINSDWSMTSSTAMFHHLADNDYPERFKIFFGQSSWGPGQLEGELLGDPPWSINHSWLTLKQPDPIWLSEINAKEMWIESTQLCGEQATDSWMA
jgi:putative transcriptional regulator